LRASHGGRNVGTRRGILFALGGALPPVHENAMGVVILPPLNDDPRDQIYQDADQDHRHDRAVLLPAPLLEAGGEYLEFLVVVGVQRKFRDGHLHELVTKTPVHRKSNASFAGDESFQRAVLGVVHFLSLQTLVKRPVPLHVAQVTNTFPSPSFPTPLHVGQTPLTGVFSLASIE